MFDRQSLGRVVPPFIVGDATPDMESRVVIRSRDGDTLASKDYSSPRGFNGYHVVNAKWSPDSKFFVYSMSSSGGHSPWQFPMAVYGREENAFAGQATDVALLNILSVFGMTDQRTVSLIVMFVLLRQV